MPTIRATDKIEIHVNPEIVFEVISDYKNITKWLPVYKCEYLNGLEMKEGLHVYHQYGSPPFVMSRFTRQIEKIDPGRRLEESYIEGDLRGWGIWTFEKSPSGTIASFECEVTSQRWFPHITFSLLGRNAHSGVYKQLLKKLKAHCEGL